MIQFFSLDFFDRRFFKALHALVIDLYELFRNLKNSESLENGDFTKSTFKNWITEFQIWVVPPFLKGFLARHRKETFFFNLSFT